MFDLNFGLACGLLQVVAAGISRPSDMCAQPVFSSGGRRQPLVECMGSLVLVVVK